MNTQIQWKSNFQEAIEQARREKKAVLLDFFNPG